MISDHAGQDRFARDFRASPGRLLAFSAPV